MTITIDNKETLIEKIGAYFLEDFITRLEAEGLDQEEKDANVVLARKKIKADAENIANLVYKVYGLE